MPHLFQHRSFSRAQLNSHLTNQPVRYLMKPYLHNINWPNVCMSPTTLFGNSDRVSNPRLWVEKPDNLSSWTSKISSHCYNIFYLLALLLVTSSSCVRSLPLQLTSVQVFLWGAQLTQEIAVSTRRVALSNLSQPLKSIARAPNLPPAQNLEDTVLAITRDLQSNLSKLETIFCDEVASYTSVTSGIHTQYFLYDKVRQLEPCDSQTIIWKISSVRLVFDFAKSVTITIWHFNRTNQENRQAYLQNPPTWLQLPHWILPHRNGSTAGNFASIFFTLLLGDFDNSFWWPFPQRIHIGIRDEFDQLNAWVQTPQPDDKEPVFENSKISSTDGVSIVNRYYQKPLPAFQTSELIWRFFWLRLLVFQK